MKLFLSSLSISVLILILSLVALGALFGYQNNQEMNRLINNDLSISLDKARESSNKKEIYISELLEEIIDLKIQLSNLENNDDNSRIKDLENQLTEKEFEISRLEEEIKELENAQGNLPKDSILKEEVEYLENQLTEKEFEISRLEEEIKKIKECDCKKPKPVITKVKWTKKPKLVYPREAEGAEGECIATFDVSQIGKPTSINIECDNDIFYPAAMKAISNSRVTPSMENGVYSYKSNKNIKAKLSFNFDS